MKYKLFIAVALIGIMLFFSLDVDAQCAMCKASAEEGAQGGNTQTANLNAGIMYLLVMPYLAFAVIGFLWYRNYKRKKAQETAAN